MERKYKDTLEMRKYSNIRRTTIVHREESNQLCMLTDESYSHWYGFLTHIPHYQLFFPHSKQHYKPLKLYYDRFDPAQLSWYRLKK